MSKDIAAKLREPFPPDELQFRPGGKPGQDGRILALAYIDARMVMDWTRLLSTGNWSFDWEPMTGDGKAVKGKLTVNGVPYADAGESEREEELWKSAVSDALKRCAVHVGIGRYLYSLPDIKVASREYNGKFYFSDKGEPARVLRQLMGEKPAPKPKAEAKPLPDPDAIEAEIIPCTDCGKPVDPSVIAAAVSHFGEPVCIPCGKKRKQTTTETTPSGHTNVNPPAYDAEEELGGTPEEAAHNPMELVRVKNEIVKALKEANWGAMRVANSAQKHMGTKDWPNAPLELLIPWLKHIRGLDEQEEAA